MQLKNALWDFALSFYQCPDVEDSCLYLQNQKGADISRLLFAFWSALESVELTADDFKGDASQWRTEITAPLRALRYKVREEKTLFPECYQKMRAAELACEQVELALLFSAVAARKRQDYQPELLKQNVQHYLDVAGIESDEGVDEHLNKLIQALSIYKQEADKD